MISRACGQPTLVSSLSQVYVLLSYFYGDLRTLIALKIAFSNYPKQGAERLENFSSLVVVKL